MLGPCALASPLLQPPDAGIDESGNRQRMRLLFWKLRRAYELAVKSGALEEFGEILGRFANSSVGLAELFLAWIDLIETVVQETEEKFSSRPNAGARKKAYAKSVLIELISRSKIAKKAPDLFTTWVIWAAVDILVDAIVRLLNNRTLWVADDDSATGDTAESWFRQLSYRITVFLLNVFAWLYTRQLQRVELSPAVQKSVDRVLAEHPIDPTALIDRLRELISWFGQHREEVLAVIDLVTAATEQVEVFTSLSGPQKQAYARDLIITFVETEFGPEYGALLDTPIARMILDTVINSVVLIQRKRGAFKPDELRTPPAANLGVRLDCLEREDKPAARRHYAARAGRPMAASTSATTVARGPGLKPISRRARSEL